MPLPRLSLEATERGLVHLARLAEAVLENDASPGGPYFIGRISDHADRRSARHVRVTAYAPESFTLEYGGTAPGFVVVPMSFNRDWYVTIDGKPVAPTLKDGVLPALAVSARSSIHFEFKPRVLQWLQPWLFVLAAAWLAMFTVSRLVRPHRS